MALFRAKPLIDRIVSRRLRFSLAWIVRRGPRVCGFVLARLGMTAAPHHPEVRLVPRRVMLPGPNPGWFVIVPLPHVAPALVRATRMSSVNSYRPRQ
jgi:hypothetical protein